MFNKSVIMKKVMCFGTFDILHPGHEFFLSEARKLGDYLVVVIARDEIVGMVKGRPPMHREDSRLSQVRQLGIADKVMLGNLGPDRLKLIMEEKPGIICLGYDQKSFTENLGERLLERGLKVEIVRLPPFQPDIYKSSLIRERMEESK